MNYLPEKEAPAPAPAASNVASSMAGRMVYPNSNAQRTTTPGAGNTSFSGLHTTTHTTQNNAPAHTFTGIQKPRQPESTVKPVEINIPDFLKNSKR